MNIETLITAIEGLGPDEQRVVLQICQRLQAGQTTYGHLDIARDGRDWLQEALEELLDACVYLAIAVLRVASTVREGR